MKEYKTYMLSNSSDSTGYEAVIEKITCASLTILVSCAWFPTIRMLWFNLTVTRKKLEVGFLKGSSESHLDHYRLVSSTIADDAEPYKNYGQPYCSQESGRQILISLKSIRIIGKETITSKVPKDNDLL